MSGATITGEETRPSKGTVVASPPLSSHIYQNDMRIGWIVMVVYWVMGAIIGLFNGYTSRIVLIQPFSWGNLHVAALVATLAVRQALNPRYGSFGRQRELVGILLFSIFNGIFETFWFLGAYDLGRHGLAESLLGSWSSSNVACCLFGFSIYYVFTALVHIMMWLPWVFPQHVLATAPPFPVHALPYLTVLSISWLTLYEQTNEVFLICLCHMISNAAMCWHCAMPFTNWDHKGSAFKKV